MGNGRTGRRESPATEISAGKQRIGIPKAVGRCRQIEHAQNDHGDKQRKLKRERERKEKKGLEERKRKKGKKMN